MLRAARGCRRRSPSYRGRRGPPERVAAVRMLDLDDLGARSASMLATGAVIIVPSSTTRTPLRTSVMLPLDACYSAVAFCPRTRPVLALQEIADALALRSYSLLCRNEKFVGFGGGEIQRGGSTPCRLRANDSRPCKRASTSGTLSTAISCASAITSCSGFRPAG